MFETKTLTNDRPHPATFEKAREAVVVIKTLCNTLTPGERETLALLMDSEAMDTIEKSVTEAESGNFEPLEKAVQE